MTHTYSIKPYLELMRLHRPIGTLLLLWPTLIALWLSSEGDPSYNIVLVFTLGVIIMRAAGCVVNDYADRNIDPHVKRTKNRPLARKAIATKNAVILLVGLLTAAFVLVLQLNSYAIGLSLVALTLAIIYPFAKRFTSYPQFILGMAFSWSIPMVYAQTHGVLSAETWVLYCSIMFWVIAYDTQYAMVDKADDLKIGVRSTAITFGDYDKIIIFALQVLSLTGLTMIGLYKHLSFNYFLGLTMALGLASYQQWLIKDRLPENCFSAFLNNNYFGLVIFIGLLLS